MFVNAHTGGLLSNANSRQPQKRTKICPNRSLDKRIISVKDMHHRYQNKKPGATELFRFHLFQVTFPCGMLCTNSKCFRNFQHTKCKTLTLRFTYRHDTDSIVLTFLFTKNLPGKFSSQTVYLHFWTVPLLYSVIHDSFVLIAGFPRS